MSGDEAVARGVYEAGCTVASAYPGTPSTEILENIGKLYSGDVYSMWACNEKVAFEIASGASIGGARAFCAFKHVGMNVAADPIFTMGYAGVTGGLVFVSADDPGCHSSQNEQDNRYYAPHAKIAMLEPSDSQECLDYTRSAFELSERFDIPVMIRMTTRVCHSKSLVLTGDRKPFIPIPYQRRIEKYAMLPVVARSRHAEREKRLEEMEKFACSCPFNRVERREGNRIGIITSGISYEHAREVFADDADYLKLGLTYPLPRHLIAEFAKGYETLFVIEENDPYLENAVRALGFSSIIGKDRIPVCGELNARILRDALLDETAPVPPTVQIPERSPMLCAGCPHRGFFYALSTRLKHVVPAGDIGCYALGVNPPFNSFDYSICMGAGFSSLIGLSKALQAQGDERKALGMLGDSTFFHSGMTGLVDMVASEADVIACVLDNSITAMTGHQDNPGTCRNLMGQPSPAVDLIRIIRAVGVDDNHLSIVDPLDVQAVQEAIDKGITAKGPYVIVTKRPCALIKEVAKANAGKYCEVDADKCRACRKCMRITCPAIRFENGKAAIDASSCNGCGLCMGMCAFGAIERKGN